MISLDEISPTQSVMVTLKRVTLMPVMSNTMMLLVGYGLEESEDESDIEEF